LGKLNSNVKESSGSIDCARKELSSGNKEKNNIIAIIF